MKTNNFYSRFFLAIVLLAGVSFLTPQLITAQSIYKIAAGKNDNIKVSGTSNVHDWDMSSSTMESHGEFKFDKNNILSTISAFSFNVTAKTLKSGKSSLDSRTYKAMKADQFPKIFYKLNSAVITQLQKNKYLIRSTGNLTIAGTTQIISMDLNAIVNPDNTISCIGSEKIKLTDYAIEPPSYMLGAMKVRNDLTIAFNLTYQK